MPAACCAEVSGPAVALTSRGVPAQGSLLDGHKLVLQLSMHRSVKALEGGDSAAKKAQGTKLVVRNVAFEATHKDIAALFRPFGQLKSCRLPRKYDGTHRCV